MTSSNSANPTFLALLKSAFAVSMPRGVSQLNALRIPRIVVDNLSVTGDAKIHNLNILSFDPVPGSAAAPPYSFLNLSTTGIFYNGGVAISANGTMVANFTPTGAIFDTPITTSAGNLVLSPAGASIDFAGKSIINAANLPAANPNNYTVSPPGPINVAGNIASQLYTIPTTENCAYLLESNIVCKYGNDSAAYMMSAKAKNIAGVASVSATMEFNVARDASLVAATTSYSASGADVIINVVGIAGHTTRWYGSTSITRVSP